MKTVSLILLLLFIQVTGIAQVSVERSGSPDFHLTNTQPLQVGSASRLLFKHGSMYAGGVATVGVTPTTAKLSFYTGLANDSYSLTERMVITNGGFVGIGTHIPSSILTVKNQGIGISQESLNGATRIGFFTSNVDAYIQTHTNNPLLFATNNGTAQMILTTTGRLGIGTTTPVSKLEVKGKTKITQQTGEDAALELNGTIKVSGTNPTAFKITSTGVLAAVIDHPATNGNPNAIILVTHIRDSESNYNGTISVEYDTNDARWKIRPGSPVLYSVVQDIELCNGNCWDDVSLILGSNVGFSNDKFNVLIITN